MLNELKKHHEIGTKAELVYFLKNIIGVNSISIADMKIMCLHVEGQYTLNYEALFDFFCFTELITRSNKNDEVRLIPSLKGILSDDYSVINYIIIKTLDILFRYEIFSAKLFSYDLMLNLYSFNNHYLQLEYSSIRNVLINCGFLIVHRKDYERSYTVAKEYEYNLSKFIGRQKKEISLEQLHKQLQHNEEIGCLAENYVLEYEKNRLKDNIKAMEIKRISEIDVNAGYDIVSFENTFSDKYDRFIEVKAISNRDGFYWSKNEMDIARRKGAQYYLYLVDLHKINVKGYNPIIIKNPIHNILDSDEWFKETQSLYIKRI